MAEKKKTQDKETKRWANRKTERIPPGMRERRESEKIRINGLIRAVCLMIFLVLTRISVAADVLPGEESEKMPIVIVLRPEKTEGEEDPDLTDMIRAQIVEQVGETDTELTDRLSACVSWTYEYDDAVVPPGTDRAPGESEIYLTFAEDPAYSFIGWMDPEETYAGEEDHEPEEEETAEYADPEEGGVGESTEPEGWDDEEYTEPEDRTGEGYAEPEDWVDEGYTEPEDWADEEYTEPKDWTGEGYTEPEDWADEEYTEPVGEDDKEDPDPEIRSFLTTRPRGEEENMSAGKDLTAEPGSGEADAAEPASEEGITEEGLPAETSKEEGATDPASLIEEETPGEPDFPEIEETDESGFPDWEDLVDSVSAEDAEMSEESFWAEEDPDGDISVGDDLSREDVGETSSTPAGPWSGPPAVVEGFGELIRSWDQGAGVNSAETAEDTDAEANGTETAAVDTAPKTTVQLLRTDSSNREEDITAAYREALAGVDPGRINWETVLDPLPENDGTYVLRKTETDSEGNSAVKETVFSINRFGSVYTYNDVIQSLRGKVVKSVDRPLVVSEYNPDTLEADSWKVALYLDGKPVEPVSYTVSRTEEEKSPAGAGDGEKKTRAAAGSAVLTALRETKPASQSWNRYDYVISADNFRGDGVYSLSVSSRDAAGNTPEMHRYNGGEITFTVDGSPPELQMVRGLEKPVVTARKAEVRVTAFDTVGLARLSAFVDGKCMATEEKFPDHHRGELTFSISGGEAQNVRIVAEDTAGNVLDTDERAKGEAYVFRPAFPFFRQITVNPPETKAPRSHGLSVLLLMIVGCTAVSGGLLWYVFRDDRRKAAQRGREPEPD